MMAAPSQPLSPSQLIKLFALTPGSELQRLFSTHSEQVRKLSPRQKARICRALHRAARAHGDVDPDAILSPGALPAAFHELSTIANILLCTFGRELTELKNLLDSSESSQDLLNLHSRLPAGLRSHVSRHIHREAAVALQEWNAERRGLASSDSGVGGGDWWWPAKVYCDFDDTVQVRRRRRRRGRGGLRLLRSRGCAHPCPCPPAGAPVGPQLPHRHGVPRGRRPPHSAPGRDVAAGGGQRRRQ
jgi:hypothetical protein